MNKGVVIILLLAVWVPFGTLIFRSYLEKWLYGCQSKDLSPICNDPSFVCALSSIHHSHGLPEPKRLVRSYSLIFEYPESTCAVFYFHGRGRTADYNYYSLGPLYHNTRCSIVAFEYPGCITSLKDTRPEVLYFEAYQMLFWNLPAFQKNYLMCSSMGCSILLRLLANVIDLPSGLRLIGPTSDNRLPEVAGVILENPPTSLSGVASFHTNYWVPALFIDTVIGFDNDWAAPTILKYQNNILILTSEKDELVPASMSYELANRYNKTNNVTHLILEGANHGDAPSHPKYQRLISGFISK